MAKDKAVQEYLYGRQNSVAKATGNKIRRGGRNMR